MSSSIVGGLVDAGMAPQSITVSDPVNESLTRLRTHWPINTTSSNIGAVKAADVIVLAVKPQVLVKVCEEVSSHLSQGVLILSIAAGMSSEKIDAALGSNQAVVRCMPNTPALVKQGASVLFANERVSSAQKHIANSVLDAVGSVAWIEDESLMDAVTALSGSGPAYFFLVIEAMIDAGVSLGLDLKLATELATQTAFGSALLVKESAEEVAELRRKVTSPNGTTQRAIESFETSQLRDIFKQAMQACAARSKELGLE
jgi:pyrroline-5-carboxylate reductase